MHARIASTSFVPSLAFWLIVTVVVALPVQLGLGYVHGTFAWRGLLASLGVLGLFGASAWFVHRARWVWVAVAGIILLVLFLVRMLFFGVTRFSGRAFDSGFFLSLGGEAAGVAWHQYSYLFALFIIGAIVIIAAFLYLGRRVRGPTGIRAIVLAIFSIAAVAGGYRTAPEWQLATATYHWYNPSTVTALPVGRMQMWRQSPLINVDLVPKQALRAQAASPPKNLIMLYVESGGVAMAPADRYPGLVPNLKRMIATHGFVPHIHASSYVTIEGLVNTQCGTLFPFKEGSESMAGFDHMLNEMPCLGDVLAKAGYRQTFLQGTGLRFAGTGRFLKIHGFNKVMGFRDLTKLGFRQQPDTWGISDVDLFKQSFVELKKLRASGHPFNLTLFSIGTHVPGFSYKGCKPYGDGDRRFLDAVHCTDQLIGQWVADLKAGGWLGKNTILVITGDHQIFPNQHMRALFGDTVGDHRLPFIVIGQDLPQPVLHDGAGYDIAPTVVDLLGIKSNVRFALGRSLLRHDRKLDYYPSRFIDMLGENRYNPGDAFHCHSSNTSRIPGVQPLSRCERKELFTILSAQAVTYSAPLPQMRCSAAHPLYVYVPEASGEPMTFDITGSEQAGRFTWNERHITADMPGLYLLTLDAHGTLLRRRFAPPDNIAETFGSEPAMSGKVMVVAWRPGASTHVGTLPVWLNKLGIGGRGGVWLFTLGDTTSPRLRSHVAEQQTLDITPAQCERILGPG